MDEPLTKDEIVAVLDWYKSSGVDEAVQSEPGDWFAWAERSTPVQAPSQTPATQKPPLRNPMPGGKPPGQPTKPAVQAPDKAAMEARETARKAKSLDALHDILRGFQGCGLSKTAKSLCFYRGSETADIMLIGEAPGRDEDIQGKPFVGQAGQLLDKMLAAIELTEADVHITNIIYWRPPGNRNPTPQEAEICRPFIERQIKLVAPRLIIFLGGSAAKQMLNTSEGIMRLRGKWRDFKYGGQTIPAMATLHPAYLLRTPAAKRLAWRDLLAIRERLSN